MNKNAIKTSFIILIALLLAVLSITLYYLLNYKKFEIISSFDNEINLESKAQGKVIFLNPKEETNIKKGQIIAKLDEQNYKNDYEQFSQKLQELNDSKKTTDEKAQELIKQNEKIKQDFKTAKTNLENANNDYTMYLNSYKDKTVTKKDLDNAIKNLQIAKNRYSEAQNSLKNISNDLKTTINKQNSINLEIEKIVSAQNDIELDLSDCTIIAPVDGTIKKTNININDIVKKGQNIFVINSNEHILIIKNSLNPAQNNKFSEIQKADEKEIKILVIDDKQDFNFQNNSKKNLYIKNK